jgi:hypothetical protein
MLNPIDRLSRTVVAGWLLAIGLLLAAATAGAQVPTALVAREVDSLAQVQTATARYCNTSSATGYMRAACVQLDSVIARLRRAVAPAPVPPPPVDTQPTPPPPPPPVDTTPTPPPLPSPPASSAELPRVFLNYPPTVPLRTVHVAAGANLQAAINAAQPGDQLCLPDSARYVGNFTVSNGSTANWITMGSCSPLPPWQTRMTPALASKLPKIVTANLQPAIRMTATASHWRLQGVEITGAQVSGDHYGLVMLEGTDLVIDRSLVHALPTMQQIRLVAVNGSRLSVSNSTLTGAHSTNNGDTQAIWGGTGRGPIQIVNNLLEGAGETVMFGGNSPGGGLIPADIEIRRNYLRKPASWKGKYAVKNLLGFKNATRVLVEANVFEGSWNENGGSIIVKSANQGGGPCTHCRSTDITIRRNLIKNVGTGITIAGSTNSDSSTRRIDFIENVIDSMGVGIYSGVRRGFQTLNSATTTHVSFVRNVFAGNTAAQYVEGGGPCRFVDNVITRGQYGVIASGVSAGTPALTKGCAGQYTWTGNWMIGPVQSNYPSGTTWVSAESGAPLAAQIRALVATATAGVVVP